MSLEPGQQLGLYRLIEKIGQGGMGVVWKAEDTSLKRIVALKMIPEDVAAEPSTLARFAREARILASLEHPNISTIYGLGVGASLPFLVLEYVPGDTLAERLSKGALLLSETIELGTCLARALEVAHARGIMHRDLKPANIKLPPGGSVKVLDFGLAKPLRDRPGMPASQQATVTLVTAEHALVGTLPYMSPEQASGGKVDQRADIWAFGCILYEVLAGRAAFLRESNTATLAAVLNNQPDWRLLPPDTPAPLRRLLHRCLTKKPEDRLHAIADARIELQGLAAGHDTSTAEAAAATVKTRPLWRAIAPWLIGPLIGAAALWFASSRWTGHPRTDPPAPLGIVEFEVVIPAELVPGFRPYDLQVSEDGQSIAYLAGSLPNTRTYVRRLSQAAATVLSEASDSGPLAFSPDGRFLAVWEGNTLQKVPVSGGPAIRLASGRSEAAAWAEDGTFYYTEQKTGAVMEVARSGGAPRVVAQPPTGSFYWITQILPDNRGILINIRGSQKTGPIPMGLIDLRTGKFTALGHGWSPRYVSSGHLIFQYGGALMAVRFDLDRLDGIGSPTTVREGIKAYALGGNSLVFVAESEAPAHPVSLLRVDRQGGILKSVPLAGPSTWPRVDPNGDQVIGYMKPWSEQYRQAWRYDIRRDALVHIDLAGGWPLWTPDGKQITTSLAGRIFLQAVQAPRQVETYFEQTGENWFLGMSWSPDGRSLAVLRLLPDTGEDIWLLDREQEQQLIPLEATDAADWLARFSPSGRWMAFSSNRSGRHEVYVRAMADGRTWQVSTGGGLGPIWSPDETELYYRDLTATRVMVVAFRTDPEFAPAVPKLLFEGNFFPDSMGAPSYDIHPDGQSFWMISDNPPEPTSIHIVLNWTEELKRLVP